MRRHTLLSIVTTLALIAGPASVSLAQRTPPRLDDPADDIEDDEELPEDEEEWDEEEEDWGEEEPLEEEPLDEEELDEEEPLDEEVLPGEGTPPPGDEGLDEPAPGDDQTLLDGAAPSSDPTRAAWTSPQSVLTLHGYLRVRGELMDNFFLDHRNDYPFSLWVPGTDSTTTPTGGCRGDSGDMLPCRNGDRIRGANMRVRLQPTLALSDDVRVHMTLDILDNVVLGSSPDRVFDGSGSEGEVPDFLSGGVSSTSAGDAFRDSIYVRRAWAEVTNRALGQLRFGRMAHEWGLGMLYNAGDGLDDDYSSEIDRIQAITRYSNLFFGASYDFAGEGVIMSPLTRLRAVPFDFTGVDDIRQFSFMAAHRLSEEEQEERLANGDWVLNAGIYFLYRTQRISSANVALGRDEEGNEEPLEMLDDLVRRGARQATPDIWAQFLWGDLRLELEAALNIGRIRNLSDESFDDQDYRILSFGFAFQGEYRLLDDALGIYVDTGMGTGDSQARGISGRENTFAQQDDNNQLTHFGFHPNYRIDLILFRNILGNVGGVYYLRPGISYDIVRTAFGQRLGARVDFIYSRAMRVSQIREYGDREANTLGLELDASVYYRSEDGPGLTDGFYAAFHYGILFPMNGLKESGLGVGNAQVLRLVLGVEY